MRLVACLLLVGMSACTPFPGGGAFHCENDSQCMGGPSEGKCELPTASCSFVDPICASGWRYGTSSGSLSDICVGDEPPIDAAVDGAGGEPQITDGSVDASPDAPPDAMLTPSTTNHPSVADTFLASDVPDMNFNAQTSALADGDILRTALFRFDLSTIPAGATINSAELHIWTDTDPGQTCTFFAVLEAWDEATTTWNRRNAATTWMTAGAAPPSRSTTVAGTVLPTVANTEYTVPILTAVVTSWVATPATNFGFAITTTQADGTRFSTREHPTAAQHAFLRVTHTP